MKTKLLSFVTALTFVVNPAALLRASDLEALSGKWTADRKDDQGRAFKQVLEIQQAKFTFRILSDQDDTVLYAKGEVKAESLGPFKSARFYNIQGGRNASNLQPVDDERSVIYLPGEKELTMAVNFDRERSEPPTAIKYTKASADEARTLVIDKIVMHTTPQSADWYFCFEAEVGGATKRFNIPDKTYSKDEITIATDLNVGPAQPNQGCKFVMKLDDVAGDECTEEMDNKSTGNFAVTGSGSQTFKPEAQWSYTVYWHLK